MPASYVCWKQTHARAHTTDEEELQLLNIEIDDAVNSEKKVAYYA